MTDTTQDLTLKMRDETAPIRMALSHNIVSLVELARATGYDGSPVSVSTITRMRAGMFLRHRNILRLRAALERLLADRPEQWAILEAAIAAEKEQDRRDRIEKERSRVLNTATQ